MGPGNHVSFPEARWLQPRSLLGVVGEVKRTREVSELFCWIWQFLSFQQEHQSGKIVGWLSEMSFTEEYSRAEWPVRQRSSIAFGAILLSRGGSSCGKQAGGLFHAGEDLLGQREPCG
jgi:hypothetical protein